MLFYEQPGDPWTPYDFKILEAYQILQDEICSMCGNPVWVCRSSSNHVAFKVRETTCYATRAQAEAVDAKKPQNDRAKAKERKTWGVSTYSVAFVPPNVGGELPTRKEYYDSLG